MNSEIRDEKIASEEKADEMATTTKAVHYPENLGGRPPGLGSLPRFESQTGSNTPSLAGTDDDEESDYDWSGEEDLVEEEEKFEKKMGVKQKQRGCSFKRVMTFLFSSFIGSVFVAGVMVAGPILVHFFWYKKNPTEHRRYVLDNIEAWLFWAAANLLVSWCLGLLIDLVPVVVLGIISLGWGHVSEKVKNTSQLYNSVKGTLKPPFYAASGWVSWIIIFQSIYKLYNSDDESQSHASYTPRLYQAVRFFFFFVLVVSAQRMLSHAIAFAFHRTAFKERLDTVAETLQAIEKLRVYKPKKGHHSKKSSGMRTPVFGFNLTPFAEKGGFNFSSRPSSVAGSIDLLREDGTQADTEGTAESSKKKGKRKSGLPAPKITIETTDNGSPHRYPPTSMGTPERSGASTPVQKGTDSDSEGDAAAIVTAAAKAVKTAMLHDARNVKGETDDNGGLVWGVSSSQEAKRLARAIWNSFHERRRKFLIPSDFYPAFPTKEEAEAAFRVFDKDNNGDISRQEIKGTLLKVYKERRFLSKSMRDVGAALKTLDRILLFFAFVILFFISLSVFGVEVGDSLTSVYSIGIAASFIFKNAASNAFDAIMFLFVTHPFDTGDRCFIGQENLVVKKMGLFATVFQRADGTETYYFNSQLFNMFINNARRSDKTFENLTLQVAWRTPLEKLDALISAMNEWLETEENRWFEPSTSLTLQHIDYQRSLVCTIGIGHNGNWQDWGLRLQRKTAFHAAVQHYCRQLGIQFHETPIPMVYADRDTQQYESSPQFDDNMSIPPSPYMSSSAVDLPSQVAREKKNFLGFQPPSSQTSLRARKSKSRKSALAGNMGTGD